MDARERITELSAASLATLIQNTVMPSVQTALTGTLGLVRVHGVLGTVRAGNYQKAFGVRLVDGGKEVLLDVPKDLIARHRLKGGEEVAATGVLNGRCDRFTNHLLQVSLDVTDIELRDRQSVEVEEPGRMTLARLKGLRFTRKPFPAGEPIMVSVVMSRSGAAKVDQDFLLELAEVQERVKLERIPVNILSATDIAEGIRHAGGDVVAVIRGGGAEEQFDVFEHPAVMEALAEKDAYRVIGLGHTANQTLLDLVAEATSNTPTAAGAHIRAAILERTKPAGELERMLVDREKEIASLRGVCVRMHAEFTSTVRNRARLGLLMAGGAFVAGALLAAILVHQGWLSLF